MKAYKILLCCGAGMSSGFLAQAAQKAANTKAPGTKVAAKSQSLVEDVIEDYDLLLIGPHFASHKDEFDELKKFDFIVMNPPFSDKSWTDGIKPSEDKYKMF